MGSDDYHVSAELHQEVERRRKLDKLKRIEEVSAELHQEVERRRKFKRIEEAAYKWFDGKISDKRMAEIVFSLINEGAKK